MHADIFEGMDSWPELQHVDSQTLKLENTEIFLGTLYTGGSSTWPKLPLIRFY